MSDDQSLTWEALRAAEAEVRRLRALCDSLAARCAAQSELLGARAEGAVVLALSRKEVGQVRRAIGQRLAYLHHVLRDDDRRPIDLLDGLLGRLAGPPGGGTT